MKNFLKRLFRNRIAECIAQHDLELAEIRRQNDRIQAAYALHRDVMNNYGVGYLVYLTPPEEIIKDNKSITLINYFNV